MSAPVHVVPDRRTHGVALYAGQVAAAVGARVVTPEEALGLPPQPVHVHVSDSLLGPTCEEAAAVVRIIADRHPTTVTLHDVPQPDDGPVFARRQQAYADVLAAAEGWAVSSHHEAALAQEHLGAGAPGAVVPLPVMPHPPVFVPPRDEGPSVVGVLGWVYPGKGHAEVIRACSGLPGITVRALGSVVGGHEWLRDELCALASSVGVRFEVAGWLSERELHAAVAKVDVPVAAHRKLSASGSINSWVAGRRRPLVPDGAYTREMAALRPGTLTLVPDEGLGPAIAAAAADPASTRLALGVGLGPDLAAVAASYVAWWAGR